MNFSEPVSKLIGIASRSESTVLITGLTGTGKTFLARQIHHQSSRRQKPFISINLATLHEGTLEAELFGHEKGAFTGADRRRVGRLELAQGGTVFLDEIGELTPRLQARLLEFLQARQVTPMGGHREIQLDVRIIVATHKDLERAVIEGDFRRDLFHRIRVISIQLSSLHERIDQLEYWTRCFVKEFSDHTKRTPLGISQEVSQSFYQYSWPGNLRELRNVLEYACFAAEGNQITMCDLPSWFLETLQPKKALKPMISECFPILGVAEIPFTLDFKETKEHFEKEYFRRALIKNGGRLSRTARQVGVNKATLMRRVKAYSLTRLETGAPF